MSLNGIGGLPLQIRVADGFTWLSKTAALSESNKGRYSLRNCRPGEAVCGIADSCPENRS